MDNQKTEVNLDIREAPLRIYLKIQDVMKILGCGHTKANQYIREVNATAKSRGLLAFTRGKANKYLFADLYGVPIEDINKIISQENI